MFHYLMLCILFLATPVWAKEYRPSRQVVAQPSCTVPFVTKYGVKSCIIVGEHVREGGDPGLRGGIKWDGRPAALMNTRTKSFALVYYLTDNPKSEWPAGQVTVWDGARYMSTDMTADYPGVIFRITQDGGKTWSKFYSPFPKRVNSNYMAR